MISVREDEVITISEVYKKVDNRRFTPGAPMWNVGKVVSIVKYIGNRRNSGTSQGC